MITSASQRYTSYIRYLFRAVSVPQMQGHYPVFAPGSFYLPFFSIIHRDKLHLIVGMRVFFRSESDG